MGNKEQRSSVKALILMGLGLVLIFAPMVFQSPMINDLIGSYCNPIKLGQFRKNADQLVLGIIEAEKNFDETGTLPTYIDVRLDQYIARATTMDIPVCARVAAEKLTCSLMDGQEYLQRKSQSNGMSDVITDQHYSRYKDCLREYYFAMDDLNGCFPFCKEE